MAYLRVRLGVRDLFTAEPHVVLPGEPILDPLGGVFQLPVRARLEVGEDVCRAPVARDHRPVVRFVEADGARDVGSGTQLAGDPLDAPLDRTAPNVAGAHYRDDPGGDLAAGRGFEASCGLDRLRRRVVRSVGAHVLRDAESECPGDRRCEHSDEQHPAAVGVNEGCEVGEHGPTPLPSRSRADVRSPRTI